MALTVPSSAIEAIDDLIQRFNDAPILSMHEREHLAHEFREGYSFKDAQEVPDMYRQDEVSFRGFLKNKDNDLLWQCQTVSAALTRYLNAGETPAPYFPWRIAIILRKAHEHDREMAFLDAWCRHFRSNDSGGRYLAIQERAQRLKEKRNQ